MESTDLYYKRRGMGLTQEEMADLLGVNRRTLRRWEQGDYPINEGAAKDVDELYRAFCDRVEATVSTVLDNLEVGAPPEVVEISTFRAPESHALAHPGESWAQHKALVAAVGVALMGAGIPVNFVTVITD